MGKKQITLQIGKRVWVINACLNWKILRSPLHLGLILYHQGHESYLIRTVVFKLVIVECYFPGKLSLWTFIIQKSWSGCSGYTGSGGSRVLLVWLPPWPPLEPPPHASRATHFHWAMSSSNSGILNTYCLWSHKRTLRPEDERRCQGRGAGAPGTLSNQPPFGWHMFTTPQQETNI